MKRRYYPALAPMWSSIPSEGEKVSAGQTVALLYHDASGQATSQAINTLSAEIEQLNYALSSGTDTTDTSRLDAAVLDCITDLRSLTASGDLSSLEDSTLNLRTMVFKRDYTYGDHEAAGGLAVLCDEKESELAALKSSLSQVATSVAAPASGVFSGVADGYESLIDPVSVLDMTPSQLSGLLGRDVAALRAARWASSSPRPPGISRQSSRKRMPKACWKGGPIRFPSPTTGLARWT